MSTRSAALAASLMRGPDAWRRTLEVKERYLAAGDPDQLPPPDCGVRREIVASWRRSLLSGVDAAGTDLPRDACAALPGRLVRAAQPVLDRLADEIAGTQSWAFLADRECRLVDYVVGDPALTPQLEARGAFPGARFGEDVVGTNGLGTAVEQQRPFIVAGSEHFRAHESEATTAGAPVRDPVTRRLVGLLNLNCHYARTSELMLPYVTELAREIEARLPDSWPGAVADRALLEEVARMWQRRAQAVVVLSDAVFVANAAATAVLGSADPGLLRELARDAVALGRERTARLDLGSDLAVLARCRPLSATARHPAAVVTLSPVAARPVTGAVTAAVTVGTAAGGAAAAIWPGGPGARESSRERLRGQIGQARTARLPVLLRGERGTGKTTFARCLHDPAADRDPECLARLTVTDCALSEISPQAWAQRLGAALADPAGTVVLQHLDVLNPALVTLTAGLLASSAARLAATATEQVCERRNLLPLAELFPVIVDVPPLRERAADIPALITEMIAQLRPEPPRPRCTPEALAALTASGWPGNVRQLRQVVATALVRSMSCDITLGDLPGGYPGAARGRRLTGLDMAERHALLAALRDAGWDREAAARDLGISRATIYRKLKRHGISPPAAALQPAIQEGA
jgi:sigma-54 dependent transcriptional regulator, acetoin dehydrogenase operon transcriptional activator AcoR